MTPLCQQPSIHALSSLPCGQGAGLILSREEVKKLFLSSWKLQTQHFIFVSALHQLLQGQKWVTLRRRSGRWLTGWKNTNKKNRKSVCWGQNVCIDLISLIHFFMAVSINSRHFNSSSFCSRLAQIGSDLFLTFSWSFLQPAVCRRKKCSFTASA